MMKNFKKYRRVFAAILFALITLLFLDFTGTVHAWLGWLAEIQLIPAILAHSVAILVMITAVTLLFGRLYCSVICPLGVFQDLVAKVGRKGKKLPYNYSPAKNIMRYSVLVVVVIAIISGISAVVTLLDPYAAYGRVANNLFQPLWQWGNNLLAYFAERADSYSFYQVDVWVKSGTTFAVAIITLLTIGVLAWRNGRTYCNTICPVGTLLGLLSKKSLFRVKIDSAKCNNCSLCARNCKSSCIDYRNSSVDNSRCVTCLNCIDKCNRGAISYSKTSLKQVSSEASKEQNDNGRREFIATTLVLSATVAKAQILPVAPEIKVDGGLTAISNIKPSVRQTQITPPGSHSAKNFNKRCTACQLCVSACPNGVLKPSTKLDNFMQPEMSFVKGYCSPECTKCSEVCPSNAIFPIDRAEKSATQIGRAVWIEANCVSTKGESCINCSRQCPVGAIRMVKNDKYGTRTPIINTEKCIGCGACEHLCASRPFSAIYVEGNTMHRTI